jgi:hypothetical protein
MRGYLHFNYPAFEQAAKQLRAQGHKVISPAELDLASGFSPYALDPNRDWSDLSDLDFCLDDAIHRDVEALKRCKAIYMLRGWEKSTGAKAERQLAIWMGCEVLYEELYPRLFVCGYARSGKDTVAAILKDKLGLIGESSSYFVAEKHVRQWLEKNYSLSYETLDDCYEDRINHRSKWYDAIRDYTRDDPARMARDIFSENNLYVGIRSREEFLAAKPLANLAIWVDASKRVPPEDESSCTILREDCDAVLDNNGTEEELSERVIRLCSNLVF